MAQVKICGLRQAEHVATAIDAGARYLGFNFFPRSPRYVTPEQAAALMAEVSPGVASVGLFVDPGDDLLAATLKVAPLDMIQLHGQENPARVTEIKALTGLPVIKAVGVAEASDLDALWDYGLVADMLLVDTKAPKGAALPGGNGQSFDWHLLTGRKFLKPWLLAGGLTRDNVAEAIRITGAPGVDLSSGVEIAPGQKDSGLIRDFIAAAS